MIKLLCNNPICGKELYFDEDKSPEAIKVQCQYCKKLQELPKIRTSILDISSGSINKDYTNDQEHAFGNNKQSDVKEEDFGITSENVNEDNLIIDIDNKTNQEGINLNKIILPFIGLLILVGFIYNRYYNKISVNGNGKDNKGDIIIYNMPEYALDVIVDSVISIIKPYQVRLEVVPEIDSNTTFYFTINDTLLLTSYSNISDVELIAPVKPVQALPLKILFKAVHDTFVVEDSIIRTINYVKSNKIKSGTRIILPDHVNMNINLAQANWSGGKDAKEKIVFESNASLMTGSVSWKKNIIIENGESHNAVEVIPGRREGSIVRATIPINKTMDNSSFSMQVAFVREEKKLLKVKVEIWAHYGTTSELLIMKIKEQDGKMWNINKKLLKGRTLSYMSIVITKLVGTNKTAGIALINPKIISY